MRSPRSGVVQAESRAATIRRKIVELQTMCQDNPFIWAVSPDEMEHLFDVLYDALEGIEIYISAVHGEIDGLRE